MLEGVPKDPVIVVTQMTLANTTWIDYQKEKCHALAPTLLSRSKGHQEHRYSIAHAQSTPWASTYL